VRLGEELCAVIGMNTLSELSITEGFDREAQRTQGVTVPVVWGLFCEALALGLIADDQDQGR